MALGAQASASPAAAADARGRRTDRAAWPVHPATVALGALMLVSAVLLLYAGRHLTFFFDEWSWIEQRRGGGLGTYLDPHNGHLSLFPVIVYKLLFRLVGLRHYTPYRFVVVAVDVLCGALLYVLVRRRLGPWLALVPTALLLFMGTAFQDLLWPFQLGFLSSVAGGLLALALLERRSARADAGACAALIWSLASSGVGLAFLAACGVVLVLRRSAWRRLWIVALPAALFLVWYIGWGTSEQITSDSVLAAPQFIADAATGTFAGIAGLSPPYGPALTVGGLVLIAGAWRLHATGPPSAMLLAATIGALTFWGLTAIARTGSAAPAASRYLYIGAVFIYLIAAEARLGAGLRGGWLALAGLAVAGALIANIAALRAGERSLRQADDSVRASLAVVEIAAPVISPAFVPSPIFGPQITAGPYLAAVHDLGSPALTPTELERAPESTRSGSDQLLEHAEQLAPVAVPGPLTGAEPIAVTGTSGGQLVARGLCATLVPSVPNASVYLRVAAGRQVLVRAHRGVGAAVYLRRFASVFGPPPFTTVPGATSRAIRFPADRAAEPWNVLVTATQPVDVCLR
jgi:hypothetical protein